MKAEIDKAQNYMVKRGAEYGSCQGVNDAITKKWPLKLSGNDLFQLNMSNFLRELSFESATKRARDYLNHFLKFVIFE